jgi:hypothetical protein
VTCETKAHDYTDENHDFRCQQNLPANEKVHISSCSLCFRVRFNFLKQLAIYLQSIPQFKGETMSREDKSFLCFVRVQSLPILKQICNVASNNGIYWKNS